MKKTPIRTIIDEVRDLMPRRALTLSDAYQIAELQAIRLVELLGLKAPHVTYDQLLALPNVEVQVEPKHRMDHIAGISRFSKGRWLIVVDKNDVHGRRRFTLGHELKHVIDHGLDKIAYANLGYGDPDRQHQHIEAICQHFAACFLMPRPWLKAWWSQGFQNVYDLASAFQVSITAMEIRLKNLGLLVTEPDRDVHTYFRQAHPVSALTSMM